MNFPLLWVGPAGSGKLTAARAELGVPADEKPRLQTLDIGEYSARYWEFSTHMEIDIVDLSMKDKEILPELLTQLLSTRDVTGRGRKMMILRHVQNLSPPAAVRLRACLEELVWAPGAPAMIWMTARTVNSVLFGLLDGFVYRRVPGALEQPTRQALATAVGGNAAMVPTIQTYVAETLRQMAVALEEGPPCLAAADWVRARVYDLLGLMVVGGDMVSALVWATVRLAAAESLNTAQAQAVLGVLARARWVPSYRFPLVLELILMEVYNALATVK
jgi:hypothetical protein